MAREYTALRSNSVLDLIESHTPAPADLRSETEEIDRELEFLLGLIRGLAVFPLGSDANLDRKLGELWKHRVSE